MLNTLSNQERAEVLTQALPYIKRYTGQYRNIIIVGRNREIHYRGRRIPHLRFSRRTGGFHNFIFRKAVAFEHLLQYFNIC